MSGTFRLAAYRADGAEAWSLPVGMHPSTCTSSVVFDFEGDGIPEVVVGDDYDLHVLDGPTGTLRWEFNLYENSSDLHSPVVADVDADGEAELVVGNLTSSRNPTNGLMVFESRAGGWMPARPIWNQFGFVDGQVDDLGTILSGPAPAGSVQNTWRAARLDAVPAVSRADAVPLVPGTCPEDCAAGRLRVAVAVGNAGTTGLPAGSVLSVLGGTDRLPLAEATVDAVAPGQSSPVQVLDLAAADVGDRLEVVVTPGGEEDACNADNDVLIVTTGLCP